MNLRFGIFGKDLWFSFVGKFNISASHDDVPIFTFSKVIDNTIPNTLITACDNDVFELTHGMKWFNRKFIRKKKFPGINNEAIRKKIKFV